MLGAEKLTFINNDDIAASSVKKFPQIRFGENRLGGGLQPDTAANNSFSVPENQ